MKFIHQDCIVSLSKMAAKQVVGVKFVHNGVHHAVLTCSNPDLVQEYFDEYEIQKGISRELLRRAHEKLLGPTEQAEQGEDKQTQKGPSPLQSIYS